MQIEVLMCGERKSDIMNELEALKKSPRQIIVKIKEACNVVPYDVPLPLAVFNGQTRVHEYGHEAVMSLIEDVKNGTIE